MPTVDIEWVKTQLRGARVSQVEGDTILAFFEVWNNKKFPSEASEQKTLELFSKLANDEAVVEETEAVWAPVKMGFLISVGDEVRVRSDAFKGDTGRMHNGRIGRVTAKRSGDIIVRSTDGVEPFIDGAHYPASVLDKRIK